MLKSKQISAATKSNMLPVLDPKRLISDLHFIHYAILLATLFKGHRKFILKAAFYHFMGGKKGRKIEHVLIWNLKVTKVSVNPK